MNNPEVKPTISVIMSVFNAEKTLHEAIESVIEQTFDDWEFIICDDCSTDMTWSILQSYKNNYPNRFILIRNEKNLKLAASLNRCLKLCSGKYIARMDADDITVKDRFEQQVKVLNEHPEFQVVGSLMRRFDNNGEHDIVYVPEYPDKRILKKGVPFCHPTIMMRKNAYDAVGGYSESKIVFRSQDYDLWFRFFALNFQGYNIQKPLHKFREDINAIKRRTFKNRRCILKIQYKGYKLINAPFYWYYYPVLGFMKAFVPSSVVQLYRKKQAKQQKYQ